MPFTSKVEIAAWVGHGKGGELETKVTAIGQGKLMDARDAHSTGLGIETVAKGRPQGLDAPTHPLTCL